MCVRWPKSINYWWYYLLIKFILFLLDSEQLTDLFDGCAFSDEKEAYDPKIAVHLTAREEWKGWNFDRLHEEEEVGIRCNKWIENAGCPKLKPVLDVSKKAF